MSDNEQLRRELEQYIAHYHATDAGDVTEAQVVGADEGGTDEDTLLQQLTQAVNPHPQYLGDEGQGTGTSSTPAPNTAPTTGLNWGPDGDEQLTNWLNNMS